MNERITSIHNPRIKAAAKLRDRTARVSQQKTILDGIREISRAQQAGIELVELFVCEETLRQEGRSIVERATREGIPCLSVSSAVLAKLAFGDRNEGLVATANIRDRSLGELLLPPLPLIVVLAGIEKPGNLGAIVRSADAAGATAIILAGTRTDLFNPNVIRASSGAIFSLPVFSADERELLEWLARHRVSIFAARVGGTKPYFDADYRGPTALVLGSEAEGLGNAWSSERVTPISIPMHGVADSLNVSVTAGILLYECVRQRRQS